MPQHWFGGNASQVEHEGHHRLVIVRSPRHARVILCRKLPALHESLEQGRVRAEGRLGLGARRDGVGIAPVDAMVVATRPENGLFLCADPQRRQTPRALPCPAHLLVRLVDRQLRTGAVVDRHFVCLAVHGSDLPGEVTQWPSQDLQSWGSAAVMKVSVTWTCPSSKS